ncbi:AroB-related putative sugar phosphate phospholyase (cyclizing) [Vibrio eleionomae]|nr:AroB-related putative sugar phosphate phospholyase (cyclizing) [Vibrio eleionomae]
MSEFMTVKSMFREYKVLFEPCFFSLRNEIKESDFVIIDSNIARSYPEVVSIIENNNKFLFVADEEAKSYTSISQVFDSIISSGFSKTDKIVAIGGGVTQDIAGFVSSLLYRGVEWYFYPTNLLTQCDSCIGSKTSINFGKFKNQLGGFYPPSKIVIDTNFLETLSGKDISSGIGEMLHYFLIDGYENHSKLLEELKEARVSKDILVQLIKRSLRIKKKMIEVDEFDRGPRNIFNYGHSFGHAIESVTNFVVPHGIAVAFGMDLANLISVQQGYLSIENRNKYRELFHEVFSSFSLPEIDVDLFVKALSRDKKNEGINIKVILTRGLKKMFKTTLEIDEKSLSLFHEFFESKLYKDAI